MVRQLVDAHLFPIPADAVTTSSDDCYTPGWVFDAMGLQFDLDVAAPTTGPWYVPASSHFTPVEDGLSQPWHGLVWCNPPFSQVTPWADRWAAHPTGCFVGAYQPETRWTATVLGTAEVVAFVSMSFHRPDGARIKPRHGTFVAFRGVGVGPARRLAAADRFGGSVLVSDSG